MSIKDYSDEDLALLTDEERAALEEDDEEGEGDDDEHGDADNNNDDGAGDGDNPDEDSNPDDQPGDNGAAPSTGDDAPGGDEGADPTKTKTKPADDEGDAKNSPAPKPLFKADLPADIEAKRTGLDAREDDLVKKFDEGDITFSEYNKQLREINRDRTTLDRLELKAELAAEAQSSQTQQSWDTQLGEFLNQHPEIDLNNIAHTAAFDTLLKAETKPVLSNGGAIGRREIERAYKKFAEAFNLNTAKEPAAKQEPAAQKPKAKTAVKDIPPNLGKVPAAAEVDVEDGRFAHLDRLDGDAFQKAFDRLSESEREEYLNRA